MVTVLGYLSLIIGGDRNKTDLLIWPLHPWKHRMVSPGAYQEAIPAIVVLRWRAAQIATWFQRFQIQKGGGPGG